jgi:hypothetical protein
VGQIQFSRAVDNQSRIAQFTTAPIIHRAPADAANPSATTGDHDRIIPSLGFRGQDLIGELIREYAQVASYGSPIRHPQFARSTLYWTLDPAWRCQLVGR